MHEGNSIETRPRFTVRTPYAIQSVKHMKPSDASGYAGTAFVKSRSAPSPPRGTNVQQAVRGWFCHQGVKMYFVKVTYSRRTRSYR